MKKRVLSIFLTLCMLVSLMPSMSITANAANEQRNDCITFTSAESFTLKTYNTSVNWNGKLYYSTDKSTWAEWNGTEITAAQVNSTGDYHLYLYGTASNTIITGDSSSKYWVLTGTKISCTGNIETLRGATGSDPASTGMDYACYYKMFYGCTALTSAPELPATKLEWSCYQQMFCGCTALTSAPALPAGNAEQSCYYKMFYGCTALTSAPDLPATKLAASCYNKMFYGCTSLTSAPALAANPLAESCYKDMFQGCTHLYVKKGTAQDYTWSIPNTTVSTPVDYMALNCCAGSETVTVPTAGCNYYKVEPAYYITNGTTAESAATNNGSIAIDKTTAAADATVTVTVTPNEGYELASLTYKGTNEEQTNTIAATEGIYSFTMPEKDVTVTAAFTDAHSFTYSLSENNKTITATCGNGLCSLTDNKVSLTLSAEDKDYTGKAYVGASISDTTAWKAARQEVPKIMYVGRGETTYAESETAPTEPGTYTATITAGVGESAKTAQVEFTIIPPCRVTVNTENKTVQLMDTVTVTADVTGMPENCKLVWVITGSSKWSPVSISEDGKTITIVARSYGNLKISARVVDTQGKTVQNADDTEGSDSTTVDVMLQFSHILQKLMKVLNSFKLFFNK